MLKKAPANFAATHKICEEMTWLSSASTAQNVSSVGMTETMSDSSFGPRNEKRRPDRRLFKQISFAERPIVSYRSGRL